MKSANEELDTAYKKFRRKEIFSIVFPVLLILMAIVALTYLSLYEGTSKYEYAVIDAHATSRNGGKKFSNLESGDPVWVSFESGIKQLVQMPRRFNAKKGDSVKFQVQKHPVTGLYTYVAVEKMTE